MLLNNLSQKKNRDKTIQISKLHVFNINQLSLTI